MDKIAMDDKNRALRLLNETGRIAKIGGWELDIASGELTWTDETFRILEVEKKSDQKPMLPEGLALFTPHSAPIIDRAVKRAIELGEPYNLELEALTAKGNVVWVQTNGQPNYKDGKIISISGTIQDISERKAREKENQFLSEMLGFGVWKYDPKTQQADWDLKMFELFEVEPHEFQNSYKTWEKKLSPESRQQAIEDLSLALVGSKEYNTEYEIILKNGKRRHIATRGMVLRDEKREAIEVYGVCWDITEKIEQEKRLKEANIRLIQSSKLAALGEMSAGIAHEINNPLTIIKASAELISSKLKNDPVKMEAKLESIGKSCDRISKIVNGLRKFSRSGEAQQRKLHPLSKIISESASLMEVKLKNRAIQLTVDCEQNLEVFCNDVEIEQVLINLLGNSIDAVKNKANPWIKIRAYESHDEVIVEVQDSGPGISEDVKSRIFDPFFTTKSVGEGTGLGLSITKGILDDHDAKILIPSELKNTCFQIRFKKLVAHLKAA